MNWNKYKTENDYRHTNNKKMIPGRVYRLVHHTLGVTDSHAEYNYIIKVLKWEGCMITAEILYPPNPESCNEKGLFYFSDDPFFFEEITLEVKCPHCHKMVEEDLLGLCPECTWVLKGEEV